ncbi:MAG TPA: RNA-binding domain-containing protein [Ignavibacteria bacterium]|nr:RNA-binding domain-containing protein [Ignavibacteria bacterium]
MYTVELYKLIEEGEGSRIEFKRKFSSPQKIAKEMIAFANTSGGYIIFGVDDDRKIVGVESEKSELDLIDTAAKFFCEPEVEYRTEIIPIKSKDVVVIEIHESRKKPHKLIDENDRDSTRIYVRYNDKSVIASKETANILKYSNVDSSPLIISLGELDKILIKYLEENDNITVKEFRKLANISERRASRTLVNLVRAGVIRHHRIDTKEFYTLVN